MRTAVAMGLVLFIAAVGGGCERATVGERDEAGEREAAQQKMQDGVRRAVEDAQAENKAQIEALIAEMHSIYVSGQLEPDFLEDIAVAVRLVGRLSSQAAKHEDAPAWETTRRLRSGLAALAATAPAAQIQQHLERAQTHLSAGDLQGAGQEVLAAAGTAHKPSAPALFPGDVLAPLIKASTAINEGDPATATELIADVMGRTQDDATASDLADAYRTVLEAEESLRREAWPILIAQTAEISRLLAAIQKRATPTAEPAETADEEAATPAPAEKPEAASGATAPEGEASPEPARDQKGPAREAGEQEASADRETPESAEEPPSSEDEPSPDTST